MSDARLVGTNPETSETVPVAVNAKGQMIVADVVIQDIPNDINIEGDLTVGGAAIFAGQITVGDGSGATSGVNVGNPGYLSITHSSRASQNCLFIYDTTSSSEAFSVTGSGAARFKGDVVSTDGTNLASINSGGTLYAKQGTANNSASTPALAVVGGSTTTANIFTDGSATFTGDVVIGSRGVKWLIRESNGVAMLIEQTTRIEKVRDLPRELDLLEAALSEVMEKLKMTPPAGWPVWDGSDNSQ